MPIESDADRAVFLAASDFGVTATYTPVSGGGSAPLAGIFDDDYLQTGEGESGIATKAPRFLCRSSDLTAGGREGDQLVIAAVTWRVSSPPRADGTGMTLLWLEKA